MGKTILAALAVAAAASAGPSYDRNLERAVMAIVAAKIGDLRSGFDIGQKPIFVGAADDASATPILAPGIWHGGLAPAESGGAAQLKGAPGR